MKKCYGCVNNWLIDLPSGSILHLITGERRRLGEYQIKLLNLLAQQAGKLLTREEITELVWERRPIGNNSLPNAIHALRTALEDDGKQQKIIKTVPRKGYVLEPDYCCFIDRDEEEIDAELKLAEQDELIDTIDDHVDDFSEISSHSRVDTSDSEPTVRVGNLQHWIASGLFIIFTILISITLGGVLGKHFSSDILRAQETQANVYSNIRLFGVDYTSNPSWQQDNLYYKLKDSFYLLNQRMQSESIKMNVFYFSENQTLNYTFSLTNSCDKKQLVMTIYHWRIDTQRLNNLIVSETWRKLDEMSVCKTL